MPLELAPAPFALAPPHVLVVDRIAMLGRNLHAAVREAGAAFCAPGLEAGAVGLVFDAREHEVCEVAEFVGQDVEEAGFVGDDFFRELDGGVVFVGGRCC